MSTVFQLKKKEWSVLPVILGTGQLNHMGWVVSLPGRSAVRRFSAFKKHQMSMEISRHTDAQGPS